MFHIQISNHFKIPKRIHYRILFILRAMRLFDIFEFWLIVVFALHQTTLSLNLRYVKRGHFHPILIKNIILYFLISCLCFCGSNIKFRKVKFYVDMFIRSALGQKYNRLNVARLFNKKPIQPLLYKGMVERTFSLKIYGFEPVITLNCPIICIGKQGKALFLKLHFSCHLYKLKVVLLVFE